ncbi:MAG: alpha/beta hydrolase [Hyphomonadaceae bacterium]
MKRHLLCASLAIALMAACGQAKPAETAAAPEAPAPAPTAPAVKYGDNAAAGTTFVHDGVTLYYETYGEGEPLLLVHGNGASISSFKAQIEFFKPKYRVIAMDSRDQGKSSDSAGPITYEKMTDDLAALLDHLKSGPVNVLGWSDGGIEALLLGVRHPDKVKKLAVMAANLNPSLKAIYPETEAWAKEMSASIPPEARATPEGKRTLKVLATLLAEPHIDPKTLGRIAAPTLIMASDHDLIRTEHTVEIYNAIPNANLAIFPNATHFVPYDDPELFNTTVERFFTTPFKQRDRIADVMASLEKFMAEAAK